MISRESSVVRLGAALTSVEQARRLELHQDDSACSPSQYPRPEVSFPYLRWNSPLVSCESSSLRLRHRQLTRAPRSMRRCVSSTSTSPSPPLALLY